MAAFQKLNEYWPENSADIEARKTLGAHVRAGIKSTPVRTSPGSASTKPRQATGSAVAGGARLRGGRG